MDRTFQDQLQKIYKKLHGIKRGLINQGVTENKALNDARTIINKQYGVGWADTLRQKDAVLNAKEYSLKNRRYTEYDTRTLDEKIEHHWRD